MLINVYFIAIAASKKNGSPQTPSNKDISNNKALIPLNGLSNANPSHNTNINNANMDNINNKKTLLCTPPSIDNKILQNCFNFCQDLYNIDVNLEDFDSLPDKKKYGSLITNLSVMV